MLDEECENSDINKLISNNLPTLLWKYKFKIVKFSNVKLEPTDEFDQTVEGEKC